MTTECPVTTFVISGCEVSNTWSLLMQTDGSKIRSRCLWPPPPALDLKSFQLSTFLDMHQSAAVESEDAPDPQQFRNWKGKAAAHVLLPNVQTEN